MQYFELRIDSPGLEAQLFQQVGEISWWDSQSTHRAHNPKVRGSNPLPATILSPMYSVSWDQIDFGFTTFFPFNGTIQDTLDYIYSVLKDQTSVIH